MPVLNASLAAPARQKARMPGTQQEMWVFQTGSGDKLRIFGVPKTYSNVVSPIPTLIIRDADRYPQEG